MTERMDTAAYLDELAQTLASHGSNLAALRMAELEQRIAPSLAAPGLPTQQAARDVAGVTGKISVYSDISNALADPTFDTISPSAPPQLTTTWQALSPYWEARYVLNSGAYPQYIQLYVNQERWNPRCDLNSAKVRADVINMTGAALSGSVTVELRSRLIAYNPGYVEPPFMIAAVRSDTNYCSYPAETQIELRTTEGGDALRATSGWNSLPYDGTELRPLRYYAATDPDAVRPANLDGWYVVLSARSTYVNAPHNTRVGWIGFCEPQLVQAWTPDPPPFAPNLGMWKPSLTDGPQPYAYMAGFSASGTYTTALALAANGGSLAIPVVLSARMHLHQVSLWNTDTSGARSWNWALYDSLLIGGLARNDLPRIAYGTADDAFTAGAASKRTIAMAGFANYINPGIYWLVIQNTHATSTFGVGSVASGTLSHNRGQTKTITIPASDPLDFTAATWTKTTGIYAVVLEGRAFGETTVF